MGELQKAIDSQIANLPRIAAQQLARGKLAKHGIKSDEMVGQLADAILAFDDDPIELDWPEEISIDFDDADMAELQAGIDRLADEFPAIVEELSVKLAEEIVSGLRQQWDETRPVEELAESMRSRVSKDWGKAIDALRMLLSLCAQEGHEFNIRQLKSKQVKLCEEARARLHIRGCRIAEEILLLLEYGHKEGAQARWRTLHEIAVAATLIKEGGDVLAERFYDSEFVEKKSLLKDIHRAASAGGEPRVPVAEAKEIERNFARVIAKYDKSFQGMYGWASGQLGLPKDPKFYDLMGVAGSLSLKDRFRIASSDNHVSVATLSQPIHQWDPTTLIPGSFAPGFEGPGVDTAQAIVQLTAALYDEPWDLDRLVLMRAMVQLRDEIATLWHQAAQLIDRREQRAIDKAARFGKGRRFGYVKAKPFNRS